MRAMRRVRLVRGPTDGTAGGRRRSACSRKAILARSDPRGLGGSRRPDGRPRLDRRSLAQGSTRGQGSVRRSPPDLPDRGARLAIRIDPDHHPEGAGGTPMVACDRRAVAAAAPGSEGPTRGWKDLVVGASLSRPFYRLERGGTVDPSWARAQGFARFPQLRPWRG